MYCSKHPLCLERVKVVLNHNNFYSCKECAKLMEKREKLIHQSALKDFITKELHDESL